MKNSHSHKTPANLQINSEELDSILDNATFYIVVTDLEGRFTYFNTKFQEAFGWSTAVDYGQPSLPTIHPEDQTACVQAVEFCLAHLGKSVEVDLRKLRPDKQWQTNHWNFAAQTNDQGEPESILCIGYDISDRIDLQQELSMTTALLNETQTLAKLGGWKWEVETNQTIWTREVYHIFEVGYEFEHNKHKGVDFYEEADRPVFLKALEEVIQRQKPFDLQLRLNTRKGQKWVRVTGHANTENGETTEVQGLIQDITELKQAEARLREQSAMQDTLMRMATRYINFPLEKMEQMINQSLEEIGRFVQADRAYIFEYNHARQTATNTYEWCQPWASSQIDSLQAVPVSGFSMLYAPHAKGEAVVVNDVSALPDSEGKQNLQAQDVKSMISAPMMHEGHCLGFVGFDAVRAHYTYSIKEQQLLELFAEILVNAFLRSAADQELRESRARLEKLTENVPGAIYQFEMSPNGETTFSFVSKGISRLHPSLNPEELVGASLDATLEIIYSEDIPKVVENIKESAQNMTPFSVEYRILEGQNPTKWHKAVSKPEQKADGTIVWYGIFQDITEAKKMEEVKKFAKELEVKNKEMEQFAYVASHDLQEPLRTIRSYAGLLNRRFYDQLGADGQQFLSFISDASLRMSQLISGLLEYSQIGREQQESEVDCEQVVREVLQDLERVIQEKKAAIEVGSLPTVQGHRTELRQLFQNLISNAIKFSKPHTPPVVRIRTVPDRDYWRFAVQDNGIGIPADYKDKVFTIFQRLHNATEYEGTGIGLANCQKIVELHHGRIWFESEAGQGTTFFFTIKRH